MEAQERRTHRLGFREFLLLVFPTSILNLSFLYSSRTYLSFYVTRPSISHQSISIHESCPSYSVDFGNALQPFFRFIILDTHPPYFTLSTRESFLSFSASLCLINALSFIELRLPRLPMTALHLASCLTGTEGLQAHVSQTVQPSGSCGAELSWLHPGCDLGLLMICAVRCWLKSANLKLGSCESGLVIDTWTFQSFGIQLFGESLRLSSLAPEMDVSTEAKVLPSSFIKSS